MIKTIDIDYKVSGTRIFIPFKAVCSLTNKKFEGEVIIEYNPEKSVLEYVDAEQFIRKTTKNKLLVEELAKSVFEEVKKSIKPKHLKVIVDAKKSEAHRPVQVWIEE